MTLPPSSRMPTSKLTRVRVDGLLKSKAQVCPPSSGSDALTAIRLKLDRRLQQSHQAVRPVCDSIERKCFIGSENHPARHPSARMYFIQGRGQNGYRFINFSSRNVERRQPANHRRPGRHASATRSASRRPRQPAKALFPSTAKGRKLFAQFNSEHQPHPAHFFDSGRAESCLFA